MGCSEQTVMTSADAYSNKEWIVYILRCRDNTLYTGITNNMEKRLLAHNYGTASRYTRTRLPVKLIASSTPMSKSDALRLEINIKRLPRDKKLFALTAGLN